MLSHKITIDGKDYDCRLSAKNCVDLEKKLGTNPLNIFMEIAAKGQVPNVEVLLTILHASLQQFNHGITMDKTYDLYDAYVEEGHNIMDLVPELLEILKVSGLIPEEVVDAKNA
jgi:hypothetical protein